VATPRLQSPSHTQICAQVRFRSPIKPLMELEFGFDVHTTIIRTHTSTGILLVDPVIRPPEEFNVPNAEQIHTITTSLIARRTSQFKTRDEFKFRLQTRQPYSSWNPQVTFPSFRKSGVKFVDTCPTLHFSFLFNVKFESQMFLNSLRRHLLHSANMR
jgi:hypothetical protein